MINNLLRIVLRKPSATRALSLLGISFAAATHAALITRDFAAGSGDALLTYDSDTGLEWLDSTITDGRSFTEVKAGWGGWTTTSGFRHATMAELRRLFVSAGVTPNFLYDTYSTPSDVTDVDQIIALTRLLGPTFIYEDEGSPLQRRSVMDFVADDYSDNPDYAGFGRYADIGASIRWDGPRTHGHGTEVRHRCSAQASMESSVASLFASL